MNRKKITPPKEGTYAPFYHGYITGIGDRDPIALLESSVLGFKALLSEVPEEKEEFAYADGKWTIKQVVGHITDTERIMTYRALCIARGEKQSLPGFEENDYAREGNFGERSLMDMAHEFGAVREATLALFKSISEKDLDRTGVANKNTVTPRALLYIVAGHAAHHEKVLREKYLAEIL